MVIKVLGGAELRCRDQVVGMQSENLFAVAVYLTTRAGERIARDELLDTFWPEGADASRRHAMRQMFYRLRKIGLCIEDAGENYIVPTSLVDSDLRDCLDRSWPLRASNDQVLVAAGLGPLFSTRLPPAFHQWFDTVRSEVESQVRRAALSQLTQARKEARWADLEFWATVVLRSDPLNEAATLARAESVAMTGSKVAAIEILDAYIADMSVVEPALVRPAELLRKRIAERRSEWGRRNRADVGLIGRGSVLSHLTSAIEGTADGRGTSLSIIGAPGIGKSRLLHEALGYASLRGVRTIELGAETALRSNPLGALRALVSNLIDAPGALATTPSHLALLRDLTANTVERVPNHSEPLSETSIVEALLSLLESISHSTRLFVCVDDGHNVDLASRGFLEACIASTSGLRIVWVVTSRLYPDVWKAGAHVLPLSPLTPSDAAELARKLARSHNRPLAHDDAEALATRAGGNPLFVTEMVAQFLPGPSRHETPLTLQAVIAARLAMLDERQVQLLRVIALLGGAATFERCQTVLRAKMGVVTELAIALESEGIIFLSGQRTLALHDCWQEAVLSGLSRVAEAGICHVCADAIATGGLQLLDHDEVWRAGSLYERAGAHRQALSCYLRSTDLLLERGLLREASTALAAARSVLPSGLPRLGVISRECELARGRGELDHVLEITGSLPPDPDAASVPPEDATEWVLATAQRIEALGKTTLSGRVDDGPLRLAAKCTRAHHSARHYAAFVGARQAVWQEEPETLRYFYELGRRDAEENGRSLAFGFLEILFFAESGSDAEFMAAYHRTIEAEGTTAPFRLIQQSARFRGIGLRMHGYIDDAAEIALATFTACREQQQVELAASSAEFLAFLYLDQERADEGLRWAETGLQVSENSTNLVGRKGLRHAMMRAYLQQGRPERVVSEMSNSLESIHADISRTRRSGELLTYCLATVEAGIPETRLEDFAEKARKDILSCKPGFLTDYPAEMLLRLYARFAPTEVNSLRDQLVRRRSESFPRPLAPFYRELNSGNAFKIARLQRY